MLGDLVEKELIGMDIAIEEVRTNDKLRNFQTTYILLYFILGCPENCGYVGPDQIITFRTQARSQRKNIRRVHGLDEMYSNFGSKI